MTDRLVNGRHKDWLFTEVPTDYLKWLAESDHKQAERAKIELARRKDLAKRGEWKEPTRPYSPYKKLN